MATQSTIEQISDIVAEIEFADDTAEKLMKLVKEYRENPTGVTAGANFGLKQLLEALDEAAKSSLRIPN